MNASPAKAIAQVIPTRPIKASGFLPNLSTIGNTINTAKASVKPRAAVYNLETNTDVPDY